MEGLFKTWQQWKRKDFAKAKPNFREFLFGLQRHIVPDGMELLDKLEEYCSSEAERSRELLSLGIRLS